jgi:hypothetical protein
MSKKTRFRIHWESGKPTLEVWIDNKGWEPADAKDFVHQEIELGERLEIHDKEGK